MALKRTHRIVVESTLETPGTTKDAKRLVHNALEWCSLDSWTQLVTTFNCKDFERVFRAKCAQVDVFIRRNY